MLPASTPSSRAISAQVPPRSLYSLTACCLNSAEYLGDGCPIPCPLSPFTASCRNGTPCVNGNGADSVGTAAAALPEDRRARVGILAAMELANSRWRDGASQEEAASVTGMGLTRFKSLFKQATGSSWAAFLTARRMREARTLLLGGRGVAEVAREVGYRSPTSFSAAFAKAFGMSPSQFKDRSAMAVVNVASETNRQALPKVGRHGDRRHIR